MGDESTVGPRRRVLTVAQYESGVRAGDTAVLARALTLIESNSPRDEKSAEELLTRLLPYTGQAVRVGITGAPGVGKSTFIEALGLHLVRSGLKVAVLAVDPSSRISGGSILGDKTRMTELSSEPNAFIRPSPSAGTLGGVARKTRESMFICEAAGYQVVLIETVGVGQSETMVADMIDCFLALMLPGAGDELQGIKKGLLELVDVIAVNKADGDTRAAAELAARQYEMALKSLGHGGQNVALDVLTCSALHNQGVDQVWNAIQRRHAKQTEDGHLAMRRRQQNLRWLWTMVEYQLRAALQTHPNVKAVRDQLERQVVAGTMPAGAAARKLLEAFGLDLNHY